MPPIYANDIGGIGVQLANQQAQRDAVSRAAMANMMLGLGRMQQQRAQDAQRRDLLQQNQQNMLAAVSDREANRRLQDRQLNLSAEYQNWLMKQPGKTELGDQKKLYDDALAIATSGGSPPTDNMTPGQRANVEAAQKLASEEHNALATSAALTAETLNKVNRAKKLKLGLEKDVQDLGKQEDTSPLRFWNWGRALVKDSPAYNDATDSLKSITESLPDLASKEQKILSDKGLSGLVRYNPNTDLYEPIIQPRGSNTGSTSPASAAELVGPRQLSFNTARRLGLPTSGTYDPRSLNVPPMATGTNAPPTITAPPLPMTGTNRPSTAAQGGYKVGGVYKGGMQYLGGNPNDPASWAKVQ